MSDFIEPPRSPPTSYTPPACGHFDTQVAKSTLSHHFKTLREAGIIATTQDRGRKLNTLRTRETEEAFPCENSVTGVG